MFRVLLFSAALLFTLRSPTISADIDLGGFLLDDTISQQGYEFAKNLGNYWREVPNTSGKNLLVKEIIVPQAGTMVSVYFDNTLVYRTYMGRRQVPLETRVQQAIGAVLNAVANADFEDRSPDLAKDEW